MYNKAGVTTDTITPSTLFANGGSIRSEKVTIPDGHAAMAIGTLLGKKTIGAASVAAKSGGNTGDGTLTMDVTTPIKNGAKTGIYKVRFTVAAANNGTFQVHDPDGKMIGTVIMTGGAGTFDGEIKFAIADAGSDDFIVGDGFDITIAEGNGDYIKSLAAAVDGSQVPCAILGEDTVLADGADIEAMAHIGGEFNADYITFGTGHTEASVKDVLRDKGIYIV